MEPAFFDAHLDLAYLAECGRDMEAADLSACGGPNPPAAVTFPSLREGRVRACLGTIFTEAVPAGSGAGGESGAHAYPLGDAEAAQRAGLRQLERYQRWSEAGLVRLMPRRGEAVAGDVADATPPLRVGILVECADPIRTPEELPFWVDRGVVAVGMAWVHGGRYAAGNGADPEAPDGLTDLGRAMIPAMDALGVVHDVSHLSQRATDELLERTDAVVMASHSNCRALFDRDPYRNARQRHLADATIREIARRGGVIGVNLLSDFLDPGIVRGQSVALSAVVRHVEHLCKIAGYRGVVGLGSDMDGGFGADRLPVGVRRPADLARITEALGAAGWSEDEVTGFGRGNWGRFWGWGE